MMQGSKRPPHWIDQLMKSFHNWGCLPLAKSNNKTWQLQHQKLYFPQHFMFSYKFIISSSVSTLTWARSWFTIPAGIYPGWDASPLYYQHVLRDGTWEPRGNQWGHRENMQNSLQHRSLGLFQGPWSCKGATLCSAPPCHRKVLSKILQKNDSNNNE